MYTLKGLELETTRKCNLKCAHCMKGEAQNITITKEIIDRLFEEIGDCEEITLLGGEPLLEIDIIDYLVDCIIKYRWNISHFSLTTNGTILDDRICIILEKLCSSIKGCGALLRISDDSFHDREQSQKAYSYYKPLVDSINRKLRYNSVLCLYLTSYEDKFRPPFLIYSGNAEEYINNNLDKLLSEKEPIVHPIIINHRIKIIGEVVYCDLTLFANGNVGTYEDRSFEYQDKTSIGNILKEDIKTILNRHNDNCLLKCEEAVYLSRNKYDFLLTSGAAEDTVLFINNVRLIYNKLFDNRKLAKKLFKYVPAQDIIDNIPMHPSSTEKMKYIKFMELLFNSRFNYQNIENELIASLDKPNLHKLMELCETHSANDIRNRCILLGTKTVLEDDNVFIIPDFQFGTKEDLLKSEAFKKLSDLNDECRSGKRQYENDKVYFCDDIESTFMPI